ncbi:pentatricopeptide repeat-containing protein At1g74600, chloroplastic-like [Aristolochia californica]|uniref:pentatricopeptide repeat-containing protein At1g74600, chloroplastic-like n=1 Tax=Aristolochia californica TaxID=171875 RepID=UPI0035DEA177
MKLVLYGLFLMHSGNLLRSTAKRLRSRTLAAIPAIRSLDGVDMCVESSSLRSEVELTAEIPEREVISWNRMIVSHAKHGLSRQAFNLYKEMVSRGIRENPSTFSSVISLSSDAGFFLEGLQLHGRVTFLGFISNVFVGTALVDFYIQLGHLDPALILFHELPDRNTATWNIVFRGLCRFRRSDELLELFIKMKSEGAGANSITFSYLINGCRSGGFLEQGRTLHCQVIKAGCMPSSLFIANALVDFYSAHGCLVDATKSFEMISVEDVISWNSITSVHVDDGFVPEALNFFNRMRSCGKKPSVRSFAAFLTSSSRNQNLPFGKQVHAFVLKLGFDRSCVYIQSALIDMYGKCSEIQAAVQLFDEITDRNSESCNSLISALLQCGYVDDAIEMFGIMVDEGVRPDQVTFSLATKALSLSAVACFTNCQLLHSSLIKSGFESNDMVLCSLIAAYSRTGHIELSHQILTQISAPNSVCYTSFISGCARNGMGREGLEMLEVMIQKGLKPDAVTFLSVLAGCDHTGLVEEGRTVFKTMKDVYGIEPDQRHYSCMVNLLGRAGLLKEAEKMLVLAPIRADSVMWSSILRSSRVHGNRDMGRKAAIALMELEPENPAIYSQVLSFYSEIGDTKCYKEIRDTMETKKISKGVGYSLVEVKL